MARSEKGTDSADGVSRGEDGRVYGRVVGVAQVGAGESWWCAQEVCGGEEGGVAEEEGGGRKGGEGG